MNKPPLSVTIIGFLFIAVGILGLAYHASEFNPQHPLESDAVWASLVRCAAILAGIFVLRGRNWARWLTLAWMAFHVVLSVFHSARQVAVHALLLAVIGYFLFRPEATQYFRNAGAESASSVGPS